MSKDPKDPNEPRRNSPSEYSIHAPSAASEMSQVLHLLQRLDRRLDAFDRRLGALEKQVAANTQQMRRGTSRTTSRRGMRSVAPPPPSDLSEQEIQKGGEFLTLVSPSKLAKVYVPVRSGVLQEDGRLGWPKCVRLSGEDDGRTRTISKMRYAADFYRVPEEGFEEDPSGTEEDDVE